MDQKLSLKARLEFEERLKSGLVERPVYQSCSYCHKDISSDMHWTCGYCEYENRRTSLYSVLYKCEKCDRSPKSYVCPYCGETAALDVDGDCSHPAVHAPSKSKLVKAEKPVPPEDPRARKKREFDDEVEDLEREIKRASLKAKLSSLQKEPEKDATTSARELVRKRIRAQVGQMLDARIAIKQIREELAAEHKDDPDLLTDLNDALTWIYENELK